jgi:predicted RNA-binding Zn ribbon-like protein
MSSRAAERDWMLAEEPTPVRLMATIWADTDGPHDDFAAPADVDAWLDAIGAERRGASTTREQFRRARALRDAVRRLAASVTGDQRPAARSAISGLQEAIDTVNATADKRPLPQLALRKGILELVAETKAGPVNAALAQVAAEAQQLLSRRDPVVLHACLAPGCVLYFARTHPRREWCSVACGNRARAARHYQVIRTARSAAQQ